jgi:hypothetical protein
VNGQDPLKQYAIYDHPIDYPDSFVVREWLVRPGEVDVGDARIAATLEEARAMIPAGATLVEAGDFGDPKIIEVWMTP